LYDGPLCVLSIVDNRAFKRLCYEVLDHDPTHKDIGAFFQRFRGVLADRGLILHGITTDGSELYPQPISEVFGAIKHQVCCFHTVRTQSRTESLRRRPLRLVPLSTS
jgi:hypothetical protein